MAGLIPEGERFASLEVVALIGQDKDSEPRYRVRWLRCQTTCCTAREDSLLAGRVTQCWDCSNTRQDDGRAARASAFRKTLDLSPEQEVIDCVA